MGEDGLEDKETWRVKHMCRSSGAEIYDLAWSPDGVYFIIGSMDNIGRIYNAQTGRTHDYSVADES
jgi:chromatin assembly factor 1 subunit B